MKTIVNSKTLKSIVKMAFDIDCREIKYQLDQSVLIFKSGDEEKSDIEWSVDKGYECGDSEIPFKALKMARLLDFLRHVPEQPIKLTIEYDGDIKVECIAKF